MRLWIGVFFGNVEMLLKGRVNDIERYSPVYLNSLWLPFVTPENVTVSPPLPHRR